jgi:hypothetical protein
MADKVCPHCDGSVGLPHRSDVDCFRELDREIKGVVAQLRALTKRKGGLLRERIHARQKEISRQAGAVSARQKQLAGMLGPKGRPATPLAARRFGRNR